MFLYKLKRGGGGGHFWLILIIKAQPQQREGQRVIFPNCWSWGVASILQKQCYGHDFVCSFDVGTFATHPPPPPYTHTHTHTHTHTFFMFQPIKLSCFSYSFPSSPPPPPSVFYVSPSLSMRSSKCIFLCTIAPEVFLTCV